jgi:cytochrome c553
MLFQRRAWLFPILLFVVPRSGLIASDTVSAGDEFFEKQIRPLLADHCWECHGDKNQEGGLRLTSREQILQGGDTGPAIVPGNADASLLIQAVGYVAEPKMPPKEKLAKAEIVKLKQWVAMGAPWPASSSATDPTTMAGRPNEFHTTPQQRNWWAYQPVIDAQPPLVKNENWPSNPIDQFILAKLEARGSSPSPPADRRVWLRRVSFDLTGLPPLPEELDAFLLDDASGAFESVVDRLLGSPAYGQRWARHWLDIVRYADYHDGDPKARNPVCEPLEAWRYRDWVIDALNRDLSYDQFVTHQIAGDLLPAPNNLEPYADGLIATTFLVNGAWDRGDADKEKMVSDMVDDQVDTIGKAFLGLTLGCARCHDHKFDPVSQSDYYALAGIFYSTRMLTELGAKGGEITLQRRPLVPQAMVDDRNQQVKQIAEVNAQLAELDKQTPKPPPDDPVRLELTGKRDLLQKELPPELPMALAVSEGGVPGGLFPSIQDVPIHVRGSYTRLGQIVPRRMPTFFVGDKQSSISEGSGRRELAVWVSSAENPLTARVIVNRVWQWHFGEGLVRTPNNFGLLSEEPSHPELLDWLAARFVEDDWSLKSLHRRIVLSSTYRQSRGHANADEGQVQADPDNQWLGRFAGRRLEAESIRDAMLSVNGTLDLAGGGPATNDLALPRRSIYVQTARWDRSNFATLFDAANPDASEEKRNVSTVAPQSLFFLNDSFTLQQAKNLAARLIRDVPDDNPDVETARIQYAYRLLFSRTATNEELAIAREFLNLESANSPWSELAHVLLCSNEFIYID